MVMNVGFGTEEEPRVIKIRRPSGLHVVIPIENIHYLSETHHGEGVIVMNNREVIVCDKTLDDLSSLVYRTPSKVVPFK